MKADLPYPEMIPKNIAYLRMSSLRAEVSIGEWKWIIWDEQSTQYTYMKTKCDTSLFSCIILCFYALIKHLY
jgi:hypothetical protein